MTPAIVPRTARRAALVLVTGATLGLAACGGSGHGGGQRPAAGSAPPLAVAGTLGVGEATGVTGAAGGAGARRLPGSIARPSPATLSPVLRRDTAPSRRFLRRAAHLEVPETATPSHARILNPCRLVTTATVAATVHRRAVAAVLAPLGPTCVYEARGRRLLLTVAVASTPFAALRHQAGLRRFTGVGRPAYCGGSRGSSALYVRVGAREVLTVRTGCEQAAPLAIRAVAALRHAGGALDTNP